MRALGRVVRNNFAAIRALARVGRRRRRGWHKSANLFYKYKNCRRHDQEIETHVQERAVSNNWSTCFFRRGKSFVLDARKIDIKVREIYLAEQQAQRRHENIRRERGNDFTKGPTYDHADGHVQNIPPEDEFFPFF